MNASTSTVEHVPGPWADTEVRTRVLIADKFDIAGVEGLESLGCGVELRPELSADELPEALATIDPDVLIVRSTKVTEAALARADRLSLVIRAGAGYENVDVPFASGRGVFVANCPGKNANAVAELTWAHILGCDRRIADQVADLRAGTWNKAEYAKANGLHGRTLGVVGLGGIGQAVASIGQAFGMRVCAWSRSLTEAKADRLGVDYCANIVNLAKLSDVVTVHVAADDQTRGLIGEKFLQALRPGAIIVNTSRGTVLDERSLLAAISEKGVRAGLDVFANEPTKGTGPFEDPIVAEHGIYGTHHVGASTSQAQEAIAAEVVRIVDCYLERGEVPNCVNRAATTTASNLLTVRHLNRPGVLAHVFYTLGQAGINVEEMENIIYEGADAACARIQLDDTPTEEHLTAIRANDKVLSVGLTTIQ